MGSSFINGVANDNSAHRTEKSVHKINCTLRNYACQRGIVHVTCSPYYGEYSDNIRLSLPASNLRGKYAIILQGFKSFF